MIRFADFELSAAEKALRKGGDTLVLRERAFAVLLALVEQAGQVVSKRELCARAWPERDVDENNLQVEILGLRRLLGKGAIVTAPGRGYQFALCVETVPDGAPPLPGREEDIRALDALLAPGTLVTLTGEGGIGKSALAAALARRRAAAVPATACIVALDAAPDADRPWLAIAAALQLPPAVATATDAGGAAALLAALRPRRLLLVLDGCDEVVQQVAELAAAILCECPGVTLLATSREVLRADGERVYRLGPLAPGAGAGRGLDAEVAWSYARLPEFERRLFRALAVLPQPFTLAQLPALEGTAADPWDVMDALARLVDKSLVMVDQADPPRYRLSEWALLFARELAADPRGARGSARGALDSGGG